MGLRTIVLKLHKPGKGKQMLLDEAVTNYNEAFRFLLRKAYADLDEIQERFSGNSSRFTTITLSKWINKETLQELNKYDVQPFKDSLKLDFGMTLANYLRLSEVEPEVGFPGMRGIARRANGTANSTSSGNTGSSTVSKTASSSGSSTVSSGFRPLYFCRYDVKRCYSLLYDREKNRYYAKLYLANSRNARTVPDCIERSGRLVYIHKEGRTLENGRKKEPFIIVPLSFGK